jgi:hypothetical protein
MQILIWAEQDIASARDLMQLPLLRVYDPDPA